jgi:hypothetical protein
MPLTTSGFLFFLLASPWHGFVVVTLLKGFILSKPSLHYLLSTAVEQALGKIL